MSAYKEYTVRVYYNKNTEWRNSSGRLHREDGPAIEYPNGSKFWYLNGLCHREDGPAFEGATGYKAWYLNGKLHREDGPAIEYPDGTKYWYLNGDTAYLKKNLIQGLKHVLDVSLKLTGRNINWS